MKKKLTRLIELVLTGVGILAMNAGAIIAELDD